MRILFVQPQPCIRALKYAEGLNKISPHIQLYFAYAGQTLTELYGHGDECFKAWYPINSSPATILRNIVATQDIDIIHSHNAPDTLTNLCIDLFKGKIPIVHDIHDLMSIRLTAYEDGLSKENDAASWFDLEHRAIEASDAIIAVSDVIFELACRQGHRLPELTVVHPNYVPERYVPKAILKKERDFDKRPIRIVYEGFLSDNGGHYDLRQIFRALAREGLELHIYPSRHHSAYQEIAEQDPLIVYHQRVSPRLLLEEMTRYDFGWAGFNDAINRIHLDTVLPNKLFEYIACGLPVISFPHQALKNFLAASQLGMVIDEISGIVHRLQKFELEGIRTHVLKCRRNFTIESKIGAILDTYEKLTANSFSP